MSTLLKDSESHPEGPADESSPNRRSRARDLRRQTIRFMPIVVFVVLLLAISSQVPGMLTTRSLLTMADSAAPLVALSIGATLVILCGAIDLSTAALASLSSVLLALWIPSMGAWAALAVILVAGLAGALQGIVYVVFKVPSFVVTLGGMALWAGLALVFSNAGSLPVSDLDALAWGSDKVGGLIPNSVVITGLVVAVVILAMLLTPFGRSVRAIGYGESAARLAGLPVGAVKITTLTLSGMTSGLAGALLVTQTFSGSSTLAGGLLLPSLAAIVIGGTAITGGFGGLMRTVVGVLIIVLLRSGLGLIGLDPGVEPVLYGVLIIGAISMTIDRSRLAVLK